MAEFILSAFADEGGKTIDEQIAVLKENNISYIEPRGIDGVSIADYTSEMAKELRKKLDDNGIGVSSVGSPFGKIGIREDFKPHFEKFKQCVENACILGTPNIRMFSFYFKDGEKREDYRDEVMERLEKMCDYSLKSGVWCCHENECAIYGESDDCCLDIYTSLKGKIKGIFDPANFIHANVEILPAYEKLGDYIEYMHIKDARFSDGVVVPAGKGDGHLPELLALFNKKDGRRFLTLEPHLKIFEGLDKLESSGASADRLKNEYTYPTNRDAFHAAASALHEIADKM